MKSILHYISIIFFVLLCTQHTTAKDITKFYSDSIPFPYSQLKEYYHNPAQYLPLWNKLKKDIDTQKGENTSDLYYLYKCRTTFDYKQNELDSLKKYTPVFKKLCLKVGDEYYYYRSWDLLCEVLLFSNAAEEEVTEHQQMYNDALKRNSKIGMAFSTNRIGMGYASRKEYAKALPYIQQATQLFRDMKYWNEYITQTSNYIIILLNLNRKEEAIHTFQDMDSLANTFIGSGRIAMNASRILMIKDMASEIYKEPKDTLILKKYLEEIEGVYQKVPHLSPIFLYNSKAKYATLKKNLPEKIAYLDSIVQYYQKQNNKINLPSVYHSIANSLFEMHNYKDAYLALDRYVSLNDSLHREKFLSQINEMSIRYNMNKLELDAQKANIKARNIQYYYACALIIILIIALFMIVRFYRHKLKSSRLLEKQTQELIQANEKAQKALRIKNAFIQNMNHEVRTPLNSIVGFSECLAQIQMSQEDIQEISLTIKKNSDKLLKIITDMLSIANVDSDNSVTNLHEISIDSLCNNLIQEMIEHQQPGVKLYYTPQRKDYTLLSNESLIHQILYNLLHNALKFTQNGEVELSYETDMVRKEILFYVRDTGPGVKSEFKDKIFERFYKIDSFIPGAGLGLALCRVLAERLDAQVYLDENYQDGCLFIFAHPIQTMDTL